MTGVRRGTNVRCDMAAGARVGVPKGRSCQGLPKSESSERSAVGPKVGTLSPKLPTQVGLVSPGHDGYMQLFNVRELGTSRLNEPLGRRGYRSPTRSSGFDRGGGTKVRTSNDVLISTIIGGIPYKSLNLRKIKSSARASTAADRRGNTVFAGPRSCLRRATAADECRNAPGAALMPTTP